MTPLPITQRLVADRVDRLREVAARRDLAKGRPRRPEPTSRRNR